MNERDDRFVASVDDIEIVKRNQPNLCSECGRPATHSVCDVRDITPADSTYPVYQLHGQVRHGCDEHKQQASVYDTEGRLLGLLADL